MPQWQERSGVIVGVAVLVWRGDQVLLTRRKGSHGAGTWAPPGGHLDMGESFEDCAIREVREETGVTISAPRFLAVTNDIFVDEGKHYATIWMEDQVESDEARINSPREMTELGWFDWDDLPQPRFLAFEHYLAGRCYPPLPNERVGGRCLSGGDSQRALSGEPREAYMSRRWRMYPACRRGGLGAASLSHESANRSLASHHSRQRLAIRRPCASTSHLCRRASARGPHKLRRTVYPLTHTRSRGMLSPALCAERL